MRGQRALTDPQVVPTDPRRFGVHALFVLAVVGVVISVFLTQLYQGFSFDPPNRSELYGEAAASALGIALLLASLLPIRVLRLDRGATVTVGIVVGLLLLDVANTLTLARHPSDPPVIERWSPARVFFVLPTTWPMLCFVAFSLVQVVLRGRSRLVPR
jgi:hypothetical protein